jgi:hypothetical protein
MLSLSKHAPVMLSLSKHACVDFLRQAQEAAAAATCFDKLSMTLVQAKLTLVQAQHDTGASSL